MTEEHVHDWYIQDSGHVACRGCPAVEPIDHVAAPDDPVAAAFSASTGSQARIRAQQQGQRIPTPAAPEEDENSPEQIRAGVQDLQDRGLIAPIQSLPQPHNDGPMRLVAYEIGDLQPGDMIGARGGDGGILVYRWPQ